MIHGYMATFGAYGSWLPNDPRGSKSKYVGGRHLYDSGGKVPKHEGRPFEQLTAAEVHRLKTSRQSLKRPYVEFSPQQIVPIGAAIERSSLAQRKVIWALSVLPLHIHIVFARGRGSSEDFVNQLKDAVDAEIEAAGLLPPGCDSDNSMWADGRWIDFLDSEQAIENAIIYTNANPIELGLPAQLWPFIVPFAGIESNIVRYPD